MPEHPEEQSTLEGTVSSIIFQNEENGYTILRLDAGEEEMTVVGSMPGVSPGEAIKGIGKATARQLIENFGEDALRVIEEEPEKLTTLKGISPKRARTISDAFRKQMGMRRLLEFLTEHQLPAELSGPLYRAYGDLALEVVRANPYVLASVEFGVEFSQADALALSLGIAADDPPTTTGTTATPSSPPRSSSPPPGSCWRPPATCWRSGWRPWPIGANWTGRPSPARTPCTSPPCTRRRPTSPTASGR